MVTVKIGDRMKTISNPERFGILKYISKFKKYNLKDVTDFGLYNWFKLTMEDNNQDEEFLETEIVPADYKIGGV